MLIDGAGCWLEVRSSPVHGQERSALFLDRDNLLVEDPGFLHRVSDVRLKPGASEIVRWANDHALPAIVVTNQSGIGRAIYSWADFNSVNARIDDLLECAGARLDAILACAWHESGKRGLQAPHHIWRKPQPGMFYAARDRLGIDLGGSWMAGDRLTDIEAARRGGLAGAILVNDGQPRLERIYDANGFCLVCLQALTTVLDELPSLFAEVRGA